jgi:hypothetical protein
MMILIIGLKKGLIMPRYAEKGCSVKEFRIDVTNRVLLFKRCRDGRFIVKKGETP